MHHSTMENFLRTAKTLGLGGVPALGLKKLVSIETSPTSSQEDLVPASASNPSFEEPSKELVVRPSAVNQESSCESVRSTSVELSSSSRATMENSASRKSVELSASQADSLISQPKVTKAADNKRQCPICHERFHRGSLTKHIKTHSGIKAKCDICKASVSPGYLREHKAKHCPG